MVFSFIWDLWNKWNIRGLVILSLLLQVFLILFAQLRKKIANQQIIFLLWLAYLMADWVAAFTIGLISHNQGNSWAHATKVDGALQAFWASFLLLHLGSPDTITAFSLKDSLLWQQNLLSLIYQVAATIYVFMQIFPHDKSLVIPTMLVSLAGVIKIVERIVALNLSSLPRLKESMLLQHMYSNGADNKLVEELDVTGYGYSNEEEAKLAESIVVKHAYCFFRIFKVFIGDLMFTCREREMSREYFYKISAVDALRVITVELHFIYEVLHTKALAIRSKWSYIFRFVAFTVVVMAFILFNQLKKHRLSELDVEITYSLLFGGIALDVIALFMLIFSDWTVAAIKCYTTGSSKLDSFLHWLVSTMDDLRNPQFTTCKVKPNGKVTYEVLDTPLIFRRWSESISACNLFSESFKERPRKMHKRNRHWCVIGLYNICSFPFRMARKIISYFHKSGQTITKACGSMRITESKIVNMKYMSKNPFIKKLWIYIFENVRCKSIYADDPIEVRKIFEARGDLFLSRTLSHETFVDFSEYVTETNYDASIIIWHIATEILYNREETAVNNDEREFSKILSDYMLYLLINQPDVVSSVAVAGIAHVTSAETLHEMQLRISDVTKDVERLGKTLFRVPLGTFTSKSPLRKGIVLAQKMERLQERKWNVMSGVWVEMLSYAASHIKGEAHVQVLSKGGELLALVWLLMAHFGCFYKPQWGIYYEYWDWK